MQVRLAGPGDREALAGLRRAWVEEQRGAPVVDDDFAERFTDWLEREQHQRVTWLALADGEPAGMLNVLVFTRMPRPGVPEPSRWAYLANFFVRREHRDAGVGSRLLAACTTYCDEQCFVRIVLSPSERSVPLYARSGFAPATSLMVRTPG
ncbi:GNAT family N-acetyltransferase [Nocardioides dongkuii]|uniref:GNAT family N-acetyltransferase n=1 Tax=Nocardioides dongkuii TaxID=2760089 RepID=UPI0015FA5922|nr:GNAT family N-acetyltransferase [Nocardioides dongkuii]